MENQIFLDFETRQDRKNFYYLKYYPALRKLKLRHDKFEEKCKVLKQFHDANCPTLTKFECDGIKKRIRRWCKIIEKLRMQMADEFDYIE